ncbi:MAG: hypothetical protein PHU85_14845 [Phycisphaerae bacterium]|nr:hypothetical protein [Phycisphaerae bacterium]
MNAGRSRKWTAVFADESGASMLEFTLLLAAIGIPMYVIIRIGLAVLIGQYQMTTFLNGWPFP